MYIYVINSVDPTNRTAVLDHFARHFPDVVPLMPTLCDDYRSNPVGSLVTVRVKPWNLGRLLLIGDAAHAVVPFFGQGMNAAFEDALTLYELIKAALDKSDDGSLASLPLEHIIAEFSAARQPSLNGLADLCVEHYEDMAANTASLLYLLTRRAESLLHVLFPKSFVPMYTMVTFSRTPYHTAREAAERQDRVIRGLAMGVGAGLALAAVAVASRLRVGR